MFADIASTLQILFDSFGINLQKRPGSKLLSLKRLEVTRLKVVLVLLCGKLKRLLQNGKDICILSFCSREGKFVSPSRVAAYFSHC
jgi:hypothetical protein